MEAIYKRCCGLDVHKKSITACIITPEGQETRTFSTMTKGLLELADWLAKHQITHVAMESTGVYWKPVYNLLEDEFTTMVVNAQHIKAVPGRKTDVKDAEWIAELLRHGLIKASFIPDRWQREMRELTRYRRSIIQERSREVNRIQKVLEGANIKLSSVATDVMGVSARAMLEAMVSGVEDPEELAQMAKGRMRTKLPQLEEALQGLMGAHQRMMLQTQLSHLDFLDQAIAQLDEEIANRMLPFEQPIRQIDEVPGINRRTVEDVLAEIGMDMSRFPTNRHISSWAKICPGNNQSAGKRRNGRTGHANKWLRTALVQGAQSASHTKNTYLSAQYHRIASRRGKNKAKVAVAHSILVIIYHILRDGVSFKELGGNYFDKLRSSDVIRSSVRRIEKLGYKVVLEPA